MEGRKKVSLENPTNQNKDLLYGMKNIYLKKEAILENKPRNIDSH